MRRRTAISLIILSIAWCNSAKALSPGDTLVEAAWKAWQIPDYALAEKNFREAIASDPGDSRGYIGLALLQESRESYPEFWKTFAALADKVDSIDPYLFTFSETIRFRLKDYYRDAGVLKYLEKVAESGDHSPIVRAQIAEALEEYFRGKNERSDADEWRDKIGALSDWMLIGPFENISASGYDKVFPPETEYNPKATYEGRAGTPASWFPIASPLPNTWVDFTRHFGQKQAIFYGNTFVYSPQKKTVDLRVGTSGSLKAFVNDEVVLECADETNDDLDTYIARTELQAGWNRILVKCGFSDIVKCNFLVRITDEKGDPVEGLKDSASPRAYPAGTKSLSTVLENPFEQFFKAQVGAHPDRPENYALMAKLYLRDDKAPQAEQILRTALKEWPRCSLFSILLLEAYQRGNKTDVADELVEKLSSIDPRLPQVIKYRMEEATHNEEYDKAEELVDQLAGEGYDPRYILEAKAGLLGKKKEIDKMVSLVKEAYTKYPDNWNFVYLEALIESEFLHDAPKAAATLAKHLEYHYDGPELVTVANFYLRAGNFDMWEKMMNEAVESFPTSTGYFYTMGQVYFLKKNYAKAEASYRKALALCPGGSLYWSKLAEVYTATGRSDDAREAYRTALSFDPRDFDSREALRQLEGQRPSFAAFPSYDVDSLIRSAPGRSQYENDDALILLNDSKRVVFERGATIASSELLVKLFTTGGIDTYKEYRIGYNSYNQVLIVEKAATIKPDGTEMKADVDDGHIVFKSLEPNDCIYIRWKLKNYYGGMLSQQFWDEHYFTSFYPVRISRYSLLVPKETRFAHRMQFADDKPSVTETPEGKLYEWEMRDKPAIRYEQEMPSEEDVATILYISSVPSWDYIAAWFSDISRSKRRSTAEIRETVAGLLGGRANLTDEEKVKLVHDFITENIRYSSVPFRQSAYVPQRARDVLVQRLGDCKDMATLCVAMLKEMGVESNYVLVNTWENGHNRNVLPGVEFNHCIVAVRLDGRVEYIDLTAADFAVGSIPSVVKGAFALPIVDTGAAPIYLDAKAFHPNYLLRKSTAVINEDNSMDFTCVTRRTGTIAAAMRSRYRNKSKAECFKSLTQIVAEEYPNVEVKDFLYADLAHLDSVSEDTQVLRMPRFVSEVGSYKLMGIPWTDKLPVNRALSSETRTYPYLFVEADSTAETMVVKLPAGYRVKEFPKPLTLSCPTGNYHVDYSSAKGEIHATRTLVYSTTTIIPENYIPFRKFYNDALKEDGRQLLLEKVE
ncbi:MAG TPA: DUF3857 domain-containing protein [Bacteroidota bacterium]|nr:DUF3857 domain-containing protein [Bacteroidota bacterium]